MNYEIYENVTGEKYTVDLDNVCFEKKEDVRDHEWLLNKMIPTLVNFEANREMLKNMPHRRFLDLAVVYRCITGDEDDMVTSVTVNDDLMLMMGVNEDELFNRACSNAMRDQSYTVESLMKRLDRMLHGGEDPGEGEGLFSLLYFGEENSEDELYIMTNSRCFYGASAILFKENMASAAEMIGSDLYVIPSSVHEVLLLSTASNDAETLNAIVREINRNESCIKPRDILSCHVYRYSRETGRLTSVE